MCLGSPSPNPWDVNTVIFRWLLQCAPSVTLCVFLSLCSNPYNKQCKEEGYILDCSLRVPFITREGTGSRGAVANVAEVPAILFTWFWTRETDKGQL